MLNFFRKYQRYFFLIITVMVIISFSFFGTYSALGSNAWREQTAFKAVDGHEVTRSDVDEMALFLATDTEDKQLYGGIWGPNFLNDGVIRKDFLETGLAEELILAYLEDLQPDFDKRLAKEKRFTLYSHPRAQFLSVENIWNYFAPEMNTYFKALRTTQASLEPEALHHRVQLYLAERQLPGHMLKQILRYQEKQYRWLEPDETLDRKDFALFGYHKLEDWFGPYFTRLVSEFIINAALLAEAQGYDVSKAEVLADLVRQTQLSYQQNQTNPHLGVTSPEEYFNEQLRLLNIDKTRAVKIWRQVLLFRRYFHDAGATALVDRLASQHLHQFAHKNVEVDLYRLPPELRLANYEALQKFEIYLQAISKQNKEDPLALPTQFLAVADVAKVYPELVQKRYELEVAQISLKALQAGIGLRELWNWEVNDDHWQLLKKQFPSLGIAADHTREERFEALDGLDPITRTKVDGFSKQAIVKEHPEWIHRALDEAKPEKMIVGLRTRGGKMFFSGLNQKNKRRAFMNLLDEAPLQVAPLSDSPLYAFTADDQSYYRVTVLDRAAEPEILTFAEAQADGTLDEVRTNVLEKYYVAIREQNPSLYQKGNNEWQPYQAVRELVANQFFEGVLLALEPIQKRLFSEEDEEKKSWSKDQAAALRFYPYLQQIKEQLEKDRALANRWIKEKEEPQLASLSHRLALANQWKIEQETKTFNRQDHEKLIDLGEAWALSTEDWSKLHAPANGDLKFFQVKNQGIDPEQREVIAEQIREAQTLLGDGAQRRLMHQVLQELKEREALSLAYLKIPSDSTPVNEPETIHPEF